jgi:NAD(P)H-flavin reductase
MVRIDETGERIPLTVADYDPEAGTVTVVIQAVGKTTRQMMALPEGALLLDFVGPLGLPSHVGRPGRVVLVGGGLGVAPVYPQLRAYKENGNATIAIIGFRSRDLVFWEDRFRRYSDDLRITTDDGSYGQKGLVTDALRQVLESDREVREVVAIGPLVMMRACAEITRPLGIRTLVSLNSIMVDGTGMCGSCRVTIDGVMRFACVDGPDFDAHKVNFDELMLRQKRFEREEKEALLRYERETAAVASLPCATDDPLASIAALRVRGCADLVYTWRCEACHPTLRAVLEQLYQHEVDHLHNLQEIYHTHLDEEALTRPDAEALLADALFAGIDPADPRDGPLGVYDRAIAMERHTRDRFRDLAAGLPAGPEKEVCLELAAEEEEHVALLETEREQFVAR